jgi:hypothetical protein
MNPGKVSAICIISEICPNIAPNAVPDDDPDAERPYKIVYTRSCISQLTKYYKTQGKSIQIHLYKYGTRCDFDKVREMLGSKCRGRNEYITSLNVLLDCFMTHFEPFTDTDTDDDKTAEAPQRK